MKFRSNLPAGANRRRRIGFTLVEMMFSVGIFTVIFIGALVSLQIFGLRVYSMAGTKLSAAGAALKVMNRLRDDIRTAKSVDVGNCTTVSDPSTFTLTGAGNNVGAALRVCSASVGTVPYSIYFLDYKAATNCLKLATTTNGTDFKTIVLANYVTNQIVFTSEDCMKNVRTSDSYNRIIRMDLNFYQWEYPVGYVGGKAANAYDSYTVTTRVTCRQIDY